MYAMAMRCISICSCSHRSDMGEGEAMGMRLCKYPIRIRWPLPTKKSAKVLYFTPLPRHRHVYIQQLTETHTFDRLFEDPFSLFQIATLVNRTSSRGSVPHAHARTRACTHECAFCIAFALRINTLTLLAHSPYLQHDLDWLAPRGSDN